MPIVYGWTMYILFLLLLILFPLLSGRAYWVAQNEYQHSTPDWKIHFAVENVTDNFAKAWNIIALLFLVERCDVGMKISYIPPDKWTTQRGREITL